MADYDNHSSSSAASYDPLSRPAPDRREPQKNFVFIDEQNRHKRLKVVKACDGCRKRKIKCESANTNSWPCAACVKLKMTCVPPVFGLEKQDSFTFETDSYDSFQSEPPSIFTPTSQDEGHYMYSSEHTSVTDEVGMIPLATTVSSPLRNPFPTAGISPHHSPFAPQPFHPSQSPERAALNSADGQKTMRQNSQGSTGWKSDESDTDLLEQLGDLKISGVGSAPYLTNKGLAEQPAMQEIDIDLPTATGPGSHVQIPLEMMPPDDQARQYFNYFFDNIHPYVPVLYPSYQLRHWQDNKNSVSPLILEAIFSCSTAMMGQREESARWLALSKRHEESFKDTPRLSTLQGLLLLLKAREAIPSRGYYYRSWTSVMNMVAMAKDLDLHEHFEAHQNGGTCGAPKYECLVKARVWHTLYIVELMIGGPQGRTFGIEDDTIDFDCLYPQLDQSEPEYHISQQYTHFMRSIQSVRATIAAHIQGKKKKLAKPALDSLFTSLDARYLGWPDNLPQHLRIYYPPDGSPPQVPFHFVANLHSYHQLSIIMHYRPQLTEITDAMSESWIKTMITCYSAAKRLCVLQECILRQFGLPGLLCMLRGINFTIYGVLTCTMLHLVSLTHPHPDVHAETADFFTRHMRILEICSSAWPMPQMEQQILSLREAFSADINKPFELRANLTGTPTPKRSEGSPASSAGQHPGRSPPPFNPASPEDPLPPFQQQMGASPSARLPADYEYSTPDSSLTTIGLEQDPFATEQAQMQYMERPVHWNPAPIIHNFEAMMASPPDNSTSTPSPPMPPAIRIGTYPQPQMRQQQMMQPDPRFAPYPPVPMPAYPAPTYDTTHSPPAMPMPTNQPLASPPGFHGPPDPNYVTPQMWHNAVTSAFGAGSKRRWNDGATSQRSKRTR